MSEWKECKLGDVITSNAQSITKEYPHKIIKYLDTGSITCGKLDSYQEYPLENAPSRAKRLVKEHDIVYSTVRPIQRHYGYIVKPPENLVVSTGFSVIETNKKLAEPLFIYHFLSSKEIIESLDSIAEGATSAYPSLKPSDIENIDIILPPLPEQRVIASVLSSLDDKIDLLHRQNKTLEAMAETLFRQWFVEEADEGWEEGKIPYEFNYIMGASPPGESYNEIGDGVPMYQGNADFEFRFPKRRVFTTDPKRFAEQFDTLISVRAPVGAQNMADERCCIGRGVAAFRYKRDNDYYTYTYFKMKSLMKEIEQFNHTGTVFGSISKADFEELSIVIPPNKLVDNYQQEVKPIDDKVIANCKQIRTLSKLRDTLLPKLMSGEVRVNV